MLNGLKEDDSMFIAIYCLDEEDDWTDEKNWVKCAPNLDITVTRKYIREQVQSAINNPSEEVGVKTKTLKYGYLKFTLSRPVRTLIGTP